MAIEAKVRKIGTGYGILIPKKTLEEVGAREGAIVIVRRIERPAKEIRGILKGSRFRFERQAEDRDLDDRKR
jgi:bifunctional DNA-binding transcriptional regulator/antitoxin component of YhaV-PrlF toxin-antitoxin module